MAVRITKLGPGTITLGETPTDFSAEVTGASIAHEYDETQEETTMLSGDVLPAVEVRRDSLALSVMNNLLAAGLYNYLWTNDQQTVAMVFTPNTDDGASWAGDVKCRLPEEIGSDTFGNPLASEVTLPGVGAFAFTPSTDPVAAKSSAK